MKKLLFIILLFIFVLPSFANSNCEVVCPTQSLKIIEKESLLNKITGMNFLSKKIVEYAIQRELKNELNFDVQADLDIFSIKRLKKGEFEGLFFKGENLKYKAFSFSNFKAQTICPYNKIIYQDKKIYYPHNLSFKFTGQITNQDLVNIVNSYEFQKALDKVTINILGVESFKVLTPKVELKRGYVFFEIPIKTLLSKKPMKITLYSNIEVRNNRIELKEITLGEGTNSSFDGIIRPILQIVNPFAYEVDSINGKYCNIYITKAKISGSILDADGVLTINKNYGGEE